MKNDDKVLVVSVPEGASIIKDTGAGSTYNTPVFPKGTQISLKDVPTIESHEKLVLRMIDAEKRWREAELHALEAALRAKEAEKAAKDEREKRQHESCCWLNKVRKLSDEVEYWKSHACRYCE